MRYVISLLLVFTLASPVLAQSSPEAVVCAGMKNPINAKGYTQQSVTSLVASTLTVPSAAQMAVVEVETATIRYRDDGTAPTTAIGMPVTATSTVVVCGIGTLNAWKAIASGANAKLNTSFYGF